MDRKPAKDSALSTYQTWKARLDAADKVFEKWEERSDKIVKRYRDERNAVENKQRRFNILWSNVQVLKPALYGRTAKPQVSRRFKDADPVGRLSSLILERCLEYETEQYAWFDAAMEASVEDRLLPGRGIAWVRYEPHIEQEAQVSDAEDANVEKLTYECAPVDYVHWKDFSHSPARSWEEVWWVRRRVYMTKDEGIKRFGDKFKNVPLDKMEDGAKEVQAEDDRKAKVSEIWCKTNRTVYWIADDHQLMLDEKADPLGLDDFFPCPKPLYATVTNGSLVPVPDYCQYQDQAEEIDTLTQRISLLTKALKVVGVHNAEFKGLNRILDEGGENRMIPVDSWAAFAEKGGMAGAIEFLPIKEIAEVIERLYLARDQAKQIIYETIGLADIMRGSSDATETLGAQQLKANFGGLRLKKPQKEVATYATALLRLMGEVMCKHFKPETLIMISGVEHMIDANDPEQAAQLEQALGLLQSDARNFRIEVDADSLAQIDEAQEKAEATEFVTSVGTMLREAAPIVQTMPALLPLVGSVIKFAVQRQRAGRTIEQEFEKALEQVGQAPQADPAQAQAAQEQQAAMQQEAERLKQEGQAQQVKGMELSYGETFAKEKIAMQQQLAAKDIEIQQMNAMRELEQQQLALAEQQRALEMRQMQMDMREAQSKQNETVRSTVLDLKKKGEGAKVIQMKERLAELGVDPSEIDEDMSEDGQAKKVAKLIQELIKAVQAPQQKTGTIKAPSGRVYQVDVVQKPAEQA